MNVGNSYKKLKDKTQPMTNTIIGILWINACSGISSM